MSKNVIQRGGVIYLLYACNADAEQSSMRLVGASANFGTFCAMIASCIFKGNMEYRGESSLTGFRLLHHDYRGGRLRLSSLKYGYAKQIEDGKLFPVPRI